MIKLLTVELRSDMCAGIGKGFSFVIDIDTATDELGIPYIPSKRLKGCLREIATDVLELEQDIIDGIFGKTGSSRPGSLTLTDARIEGYDKEAEAIEKAIESGEIRPNDLSELFCSVRAGTAIENDTVKDQSLRFVRVVNRLAPTDGQPLKFNAVIEFDANYEREITNLVACLRNIGYHRNRGLGYVKCTLSDYDSGYKFEEKSFDDSKTYKLDYLIKLNGDLMMPADDANHSMDYIPGTSVLGSFAGRYIRRYGEEDFNDIFYSDNVKFGNAYISDKNGTTYIPAPGFLAKIKAAKEDSEKGIHNMIANETADSAKAEKPQYKPLKKGYITFENGGEGYIEPKTEIVYHNALNTKESEERGGLYTQYCVSSGQYYKGYIEAKGSAMKKLYPLFESGILSFGRSKNSQYSTCFVEDISVSEKTDSKVNVSADKKTAFVLLSDLILKKDGKYTVTIEDLCEALGFESASLNRFSIIKTGVISGYNSKWNMKKPQIPAVKAGSVLIFEGAKPKDTYDEYFRIGLKQNEGFGLVKVIADVSALSVSKTENSDAGTVVESAVLKKALEVKANDKVLEKAFSLADEINVNSSQVGRITLMCKESKNFDDFENRINSIKTDKVRKNAKHCFGKDNIQSLLTNADWKKQQNLIITALTLKKYQIKKGDR